MPLIKAVPKRRLIDEFWPECMINTGEFREIEGAVQILNAEVMHLDLEFCVGFFYMSERDLKNI